MFGKKKQSRGEKKPTSSDKEDLALDDRARKEVQKHSQKPQKKDARSVPSAEDFPGTLDINESEKMSSDDNAPENAARSPLKDNADAGIDSGHRDENGDEKQEKSPKAFDSDNLAESVNNAVSGQDNAHPEESLRIQNARNRIWLDLKDGIDLKALVRMDSKRAREEVLTAVEEISKFRALDLTSGELSKIARECADDMLGFGPLEPLLEQDNVNDIMINGPDVIYVERNGKIDRTNIRFRDNQHLTTICQRIVGAIGRRVDESSPICDARLPDGSRVNVIIPPLAVDGSCMTIRKFTKEKLTLEKLLEFGSMTPSCAKLIMAIGRSRVNVLVSGGTGSGKTTMLNCLTRYIESGERIVTCEDACELQLQQPHVVRLETRPPNLEGMGEVTMRDLVKNCLRMRPDRIIVGEVRGPEAFDLLQAMNTGHDGSMGTVHANNPREGISRMENMIAMGGLNLPTVAVREQIASAVQVIIQVQRLRDGSRKVTHVTELTGMEGEVVTMQDLFKLEIQGEDDSGKLLTHLKSSGLRPRFIDKARQFGVDHIVKDAMEEAYG